MSYGLCRQCQCLTLGEKLRPDGLCVTCGEEPEYGTPLAMSDRLRMLASAQRAASGEARILCLADGCRNPAREWWYVCSRACRDRLVEQES